MIVCLFQKVVFISLCINKRFPHFTTLDESDFQKSKISGGLDTIQMLVEDEFQIHYVDANEVGEGKTFLKAVNQLKVDWGCINRQIVVIHVMCSTPVNST